ncbi:hypothetical protein AK812_SmicGene13974 [Symbiodinium microadriaticum]|uniref:Uncharacterized protein n=1 Tax=Symbiodinium microadriaticum TaxID=2951 RepID=A0A1Q9E6Q0_SYMMI|nr:hypothetical protein AK812_SmicGene13974 [Symbiodinium microadriaticum]
MIFFAQDGDLVAATLLRLFELTAFISNVIYETDDETVGGTRDRRPVQAKTPPPPPPRKRESPARPWVVQETGALCKRRRLRRHRPERGKALRDRGWYKRQGPCASEDASAATAPKEGKPCETVGGTRDRGLVQAKTPPPPPPRKRESPARPWVVQETGALCKRRRLRRHRPERGKALQPHRYVFLKIFDQVQGEKEFFMEEYILVDSTQGPPRVEIQIYGQRVLIDALDRNSLSALNDKIASQFGCPVSAPVCRIQVCDGQQPAPDLLRIAEMDEEAADKKNFLFHLKVVSAKLRRSTEGPRRIGVNVRLIKPDGQAVE